MIALLLSAALCGSPSAPDASTVAASTVAAPIGPEEAVSLSSSASGGELTPVVHTIAGVPLSDVDLSDPHDAAHLVLGGGVALTIGSAAAYLAGLEAQRQLVSTTHTREQADALMIARSINGGISVASLVLGIGALGGGIVWLSQAGPPTATATTTATVATAAGVSP